MIKTENLSKFYGNTKALKNINIEFEKGKIYGVVGENGAGKTTLFRCIAKLESYEGKIITKHKRLKDDLGYLFTEPFIFPKITGKEYIRLLTNARNLNLTDIEDKNVFDLPLNQYASTYSTGMKKKLALTGILLQNNNFFILDEPYNGVDIESNLLITEIIHKLKELGKTIILSSHIFSTLVETCDEIYLLKGGELISKVYKEDFSKLETKMKMFTIGNKIERLNLK